jgi:uncharacterized protein (DUF433 family)
MDRPDTLIQVLPPCLHWSGDGDVRVVGRRIALFDILHAYRTLGKSAELIAEEYEVTPELIRDVLAFAQRHPAQVAFYMSQCQAEIDRRLDAYTPGPAALRIGRMVAERQAQKSDAEC